MDTAKTGTLLGRYSYNSRVSGYHRPRVNAALHDEAVMRLQYVAQIVYSEYMTDEEKTQAIAEIIGHP